MHTHRALLYRKWRFKDDKICALFFFETMHPGNMEKHFINYRFILFFDIYLLVYIKYGLTSITFVFIFMKNDTATENLAFIFFGLILLVHSALKWFNSDTKSIDNYVTKIEFHFWKIYLCFVSLIFFILLEIQSDQESKSTQIVFIMVLYNWWKWKSLKQST